MDDFEQTEKYASFCVKAQAQERQRNEEYKFLKNINEKFENGNAQVYVGRKKMRHQYFMTWQNQNNNIKKLNKNALLLLLFCTQNVAFCNVVPYSKTEIAKRLEPRLDVICNNCKILIENNYLLDYVSRKFLVINPEFGWKGGDDECIKFNKLIYTLKVEELDIMIQKAYKIAKEAKK